jgi:hypothetical protein
MPTMQFHNDLPGGGHSDTCTRTHKNDPANICFSQTNASEKEKSSIKKSQLTKPSGLLQNETTIIYDESITEYNMNLLLRRKSGGQTFGPRGGGVIKW